MALGTATPSPANPELARRRRSSESPGPPTPTPRGPAKGPEDPNTPPGRGEAPAESGGGSSGLGNSSAREIKREPCATLTAS